MCFDCLFWGERWDENWFAAVRERLFFHYYLSRFGLVIGHIEAIWQNVQNIRHQCKKTRLLQSKVDTWKPPSTSIVGTVPYEVMLHCQGWESHSLTIWKNNKDTRRNYTMCCLYFFNIIKFGSTLYLKLHIFSIYCTPTEIFQVL